MRLSRGSPLVALAAALTVAVSVVVGVALWRRSGPDHPAAALCAVPTSRPPGTATAAPSGGLRVVESGVTQSNNGTGLGVNMGAIVENTTTLVAYGTIVSFAIFDAQHAPASDPAEVDRLDVVVPVIMPGQRIGVGNWTTVRVATERPFAPARVAALEVTIGGTRGWAQADPRSFAAVPTTHNGTASSAHLVGYTVTSPYCATVTSRGVAVIYRDQTGTLIGGDIALPYTQICEPGQHNGSITINGVPAGSDDTRTEVYAYCDPTR